MSKQGTCVIHDPNTVFERCYDAIYFYEDFPEVFTLGGLCGEHYVLVLHGSMEKGGAVFSNRVVWGVFPSDYSDYRIPDYRFVCEDPDCDDVNCEYVHSGCEGSRVQCVVYCTRGTKYGCKDQKCVFNHIISPAVWLAWRLKDKQWVKINGPFIHHIEQMIEKSNKLRANLAHCKIKWDSMRVTYNPGARYCHLGIQKGKHVQAYHEGTSKPVVRPKPTLGDFFNSWPQTPSELNDMSVVSDEQLGDTDYHQLDSDDAPEIDIDAIDQYGSNVHVVPAPEIDVNGQDFPPLGNFPTGG